MKKKPLLIYVNPKSSGVKEFNLSFKKIFIVASIILGITILSLKYSVDIIVDFSQNSKIANLKNENKILQSEREKSTLKISDITTNIGFLEQRDDQIRAMLDLPPINPDVREVGIGGADPEANNPINVGELSFGNELFNSLKLLEKLEREVRLEKESYEKLLTTVERRQDSLRYLPVLKPVHNAYVSSGFGMRRHPIHRKMHFHKGIDLATNKGTPIIASADGQVVKSGRNGGYGLQIVIDHKYGFKTIYGHMNKIYVRKGQFVKRGDKIGEVGKTGLATSSHLHYEVHFKGKPLNPINFYFK